MYRQVQAVRDDMLTLERTLRDGILADSTREMGERAAQGMAMVDQMIQSLNEALETHEMGEPTVDRTLVEATMRALNLAWSRAEEVALATNVHDMRRSLVDFKTYVDFAAAYIASALGTELEL